LIIPEFINKENQFEIDIGADPDDNFGNNDMEILCSSVMNEINFISLQLFQLWHKYIDLLKISPRFIGAVLGFEYNQKMKQRWNQFIQKKHKLSEDPSFAEQDKGVLHT